MSAASNNREGWDAREGWDERDARLGRAESGDWDARDVRDARYVDSPRSARDARAFGDDVDRYEPPRNMRPDVEFPVGGHAKAPVRNETGGRQPDVEFPVGGNAKASARDEANRRRPDVEFPMGGRAEVSAQGAEYRRPVRREGAHAAANRQQDARRGDAAAQNPHRNDAAAQGGRSRAERADVEFPMPERDEYTPDTAGFSGLIRSFGYALAGIKNTVFGERNMRIHVVVMVVALVACALLQCQPMEWCIVITFIVLVLSAELFNTALEAVVDLETRGRRHPLAKKAKDAAAGAVLILAIGAVIAGLTVYLTAFIRLLG